MKIVVAGDFCSRIRFGDIIEKGSYEQLLDSELRACIHNADYSIVNFEFPIVLTESEPIFKCGPNLRGTIKSIDFIKYAGFSCCTLANNHILDYGPIALLDTKLLLQNAGVDTIGVGENIEEAARVLYKHIGDKVLAVINCCEHEFSIASQTSPGSNPLNPIKQYYSIREASKKADYVLVIVHGGHEHWQLPSPRMQELYRFFIDCGADAVVNHHQHCYSGSEVYAGKPIIYGLGNFCFDIYPPRVDDLWNYGCVAEIEFNGTNVSFKLIPIKQCDNQVKVRIDNREYFDKRQSELNSIISNSQILHEKTHEYYDRSLILCNRVMNPITNRYILALQNRKLLPSIVTKNWLVTVENFVLCESHRDKLEFFFESSRSRK